MKFEDALSKLEETVKKLEAGDVNLDSAIKEYQEAMALVAHCQKKLDEAQELVVKLAQEGTVKDFK